MHNRLHKLLQFIIDLIIMKYLYLIVVLLAHLHILLINHMNQAVRKAGFIMCSQKEFGSACMLAELDLSHYCLQNASVYPGLSIKETLMAPCYNKQMHRPIDTFTGKETFRLPSFNMALMSYEQ